MTRRFSVKFIVLWLSSNYLLELRDEMTCDSTVSFCTLKVGDESIYLPKLCSLEESSRNESGCLFVVSVSSFFFAWSTSSVSMMSWMGDGYVA